VDTKAVTHAPKFTNAPNSGHGTLRPEHLWVLADPSAALE